MVANDYTLQFADGENDVEAYNPFDVVSGADQSVSSNGVFGTAGSAAVRKYIQLPNGAQLTINAPRVPSVSTPKVICTTQAGLDWIVEWDYDSTNPGGHYTITYPDRTQWVLQAPSSFWAYFVPTQIKDQLGNTVNLTYSASSIGNFPVLSQFVDASTSTALLTITRTSGTDNIASVTDAYGRSVYYHDTTPTSAPMPILNTVSQVVPTGTSTPPLRYTYGYSVTTILYSTACPYAFT